MDEFKKWRADLRQDDVQVRAAAAEQLCLAGPASVGAAVDLVQACGDDESVRNWSIAALEELGQPPVESIEPLVALLSSPDPLIVYWSATLLGRLGPQASVSEMALARVLSESQDDAAKERAAWALGKIGVESEAAIVGLRQATGSADPRLVRLAKAALAQANVR